jgi:hypothetical protein
VTEGGERWYRDPRGHSWTLQRTWDKRISRGCPSRIARYSVVYSETLLRGTEWTQRLRSINPLQERRTANGAQSRPPNLAATGFERKIKVSGTIFHRSCLLAWSNTSKGPIRTNAWILSVSSCILFQGEEKGVRNHFQPACADLQAGSMGEIKGDILPFSAAASPLVLISRRGVG